MKIDTWASINLVRTHSIDTQNRDQPEVQLCVGTFEVDVLAHVASRISSSPSIRHPG